MEPRIPHSSDRVVKIMRRLFLTTVTASLLFLIPWIVYLSVNLTNNYVVHQWRIAWVGFDIALILSIGITCVLAWFRRQLLIPWSVVTATLLCCDAWFDVMLDWGTQDQVGSLITAGCGEIPFAAYLFYVARRMVVLTVRVAWHLAALPGPPPSLLRMSIMLITQLPESPDRQEIASRPDSR